MGTRYGKFYQYGRCARPSGRVVALRSFTGDPKLLAAVMRVDAECEAELVTRKILAAVSILKK